MPTPRRLQTTALVLLLAAFLSPASPALGQALDRPLRVFVDCSGFQYQCDSDYYVEQIPWVDFVRDQRDADVHLLVTRESTGGGGTSYVLEFRGREAFEGQLITLGTTTPADATEDMVRSAIVELARRGLAPFAAATPVSPRVEVLPPEPEAEEEALTPEADPWDRWTFQMRVNGFMNGESQRRSLNSSANISADRVTEDWKVEIDLGGSLSQTVIDITDTRFTQESFSGSVLTARTVGDHWAAGGILSWKRSTFNNYRHSARLAPAIEYNVFPYSESNRKLLTLLYAIGPRYNDYDEITLFQETEETLIEQVLVVSYDVAQPWGSIDASLNASHYLTKFGNGDSWPEPQYNIDFFGGFDVRLFRGLSLNLGGFVGMVRGQIQLAAAGLTEEEILTRQRELATDYRYHLRFGLRYQFGSIFTTVVNRRFEALR
jgi:hypothetical protein